MTAKDRIKDVLDSGEILSASEIAERCGVSRQRAYQIFSAEGWRAPRDGRKGGGRRSAALDHGMTARAVTGGVSSSVTKTVGGQISELLVSADLLARGYKPFAPVSRGSVFDIVAVNPFSGQVLTIDVKSGRREPSGRVSFQKNYTVKTKNIEREPDYYAVVLIGEPVVYEPDIPTVGRLRNAE